MSLRKILKSLSVTNSLSRYGDGMNSEHGVSLTDYPARPRVHSVITGCLLHAWVCAGDQGRQRWLLPSGCCRPGRRKTLSDAHTAIYGTGPTCPVSAGRPSLWLPVWLLQAHPTQALYRSALMPGNERHTALSLSFQETPSKCQCSACWQCQSQTNRSPNEQISTCWGGEENDTRVSDLNPESHRKSPTFPNDNDHGPIIKSVTSSKSLHQTLFRHKAS